MKLYNKPPKFPPTEPKFFRNFRLFCAIAFSILFCLYIWILFVGFVSHIHKPTLYVSELLSNHYLSVNDFDYYKRKEFLKEFGGGNFTYPGIYFKINIRFNLRTNLLTIFKIELTICPKLRKNSFEIIFKVFNIF